MSHAMDEDARRVSDDERSEDEDRRPGGNRNVEKSDLAAGVAVGSENRRRYVDSGDRARWRDAHPIGVHVRDVEASRAVA